MFDNHDADYDASNYDNNANDADNDTDGNADEGSQVCRLTRWRRGNDCTQVWTPTTGQQLMMGGCS